MDDDWTVTAATDDALVADFLLKLKYSAQTRTATMLTRTETKSAMYGSMIPFRWERRKARSRPDFTGFALSKEIKERGTRSPITPLSWSGGCGTTSVSGSGNVDGFEASSMMYRKSTGSRSKITAAYELANSKKAKRKKTYNELKKEECLLLDERLNLKRELANVHATLNHHKTTNQNLKRKKTMNTHSRRITTAVAEHPFVHVRMHTTPSVVQSLPSAFKAPDSNNEIPHPSLTSLSSNNIPEVMDKKPVMLLDLNMPPSLEQNCY